MTVDYLFQRYGRLQHIKIVDQCVAMIKMLERSDKDRLLFLFLDEVFVKNKHKSV